MDQGVGIPRKGPTPDPLSFAGLRADGLRMIQEMCGDTWTDHNLHDPGVTLLEQICYALTDLVYRTDFEVEDHLCGEDGSVPFAEQSLHLPGEILPPRPTAPADQRRALLDEVEGLREAWILTSENQKYFGREVPPAPGVMIAVVRRESSKEWKRSLGEEDLKRKARGALISNRNLCEDFDPEIAVATEVQLKLTGRVEIRDDRDAEEVLAELKHVAAQYIAGGPKHDSAGEALAKGVPLDEVLSVTAHDGEVSREENYLGGFARIYKTELTTLIADIDGIEAIHQLDWALFDEQAETASDDVAALRTGPSVKEDDLGDMMRRLGWSVGAGRWVVPSMHSVRDVEVSRGGELLTLRRSDRRRIEAQLEQRYQAHRPTRPYEPIRELFDEPAGYWQDLSHYESIQAQLPGYYGLGHDGVPHWADRGMIRSTRQTRSYLMIIEQLLVNYLTDLQGLRKWFSTSDVSSARHRGEPVHKSMPGYEEPPEGSLAPEPGLEVYKRDPTQSLRATLAEVEDARDRRRRSVDHLLATFGIYESFAGLHEILFGDEGGRSPLPDSDDVEDRAEMAWTLGRRIELLRHAPEFTRDRGGSYDSARRLWKRDDNVSGFRRRIGLLLGLTPADFAPRPLADQNRTGFHIVEHVLLRPTGAKAPDENPEPQRHFTEDRYWNRMTIVFSEWTIPGNEGASSGSEEDTAARARREVRAQEYRQYVQRTIRQHRPAHIGFDILWLDEAEMRDFESAFEGWTTARCRWLNDECRKEGENCERLVARSAGALRDTIERLVAAPERNS